MKKLLKDESLSIKKRIMDNRLHNTFMRGREKIIDEQWDADTDKNLYGEDEMEKKIRHLKNHKDKRETIKARVITETLKTKRRVEAEINTIRKGPVSALSFHVRSRSKDKKFNESISKWR